MLAIVIANIRYTVPELVPVLIDARPWR